MKSSNSQTKVAKLSLLASFLITFLCMYNPYFVWADVDLIDEGKSDSAVKMLVFPKSLRVIESLRNESRGQEVLFSDSKRIRKTLLKIDPARIAPAKEGESIYRTVTRERLLKLSKKYSEDVIFIFRRKLKAVSGRQTENTILYQGMLYLARQKKVLVLKGNEKTKPVSDSGSPQEIIDRLMDLDDEGLKDLAREARTVLHSHKFEKRQSAY